VIALDGVAKAYATTGGRKIVLENATVAFAPGHNFGILGANGVGKSTLIRLLAGSEMPDRGTIRRDARVSFPLGFGGTFHGALCGRENVAFIARVYGAGLRPTIRFVEEFAELGEYFRYYGAKYCTFLGFAEYHNNAVEFFDIGNHLELAERLSARPQFSARCGLPEFNIATNKATYLLANSNMANSKMTDPPVGLDRERDSFKASHQKGRTA